MLRLSQNLHFEVHKVLRLSRHFQFEVRNALRLPRNLQKGDISRSHASQHLAGKSELVEDHHHVQSAVPARKSTLPNKTALIPCACHDKSALNHENTRFPCHLPRKMTTMCENAHDTTTRALSLEAPAAPTQISRACAAEMHFEDIEWHECTVNRSELAAHARTLTSPKCVHTD